MHNFLVNNRQDGKDDIIRLFDIRESVKKGECTDESLDLTKKILLINPDFYTVWNIRKETLLAIDFKSWDDELSFTIQCLKKNEKSYSTWQHRIWVLSNMSSEAKYQDELKLCSMFLSKDERNFHCWDYRSHISKLAKVDLVDELEFTTKMIKSNFSNFSAWHRRHKIFLEAYGIEKDLRPKSIDLDRVLGEELNLVLHAIYTDPNDQSCWKYHNFLVRNAKTEDLIKEQEHKKELLNLLEYEPNIPRLKKGVEYFLRFVN